MIDLRDLVYYLSLTGIFLVLNVAVAGQQALEPRRRGTAVAAARRDADASCWSWPTCCCSTSGSTRSAACALDLTAQHEYSLSPTTRDLLRNLQEPLLIRGYFSEKTHPLLAPLRAAAPRHAARVRDRRSDGKVQRRDRRPGRATPSWRPRPTRPTASSPTPFQVAGRYEASVINSYFDILIRYGDQNVVLSFSDLIEVQSPSRRQRSTCACATWNTT